MTHGFIEANDFQHETPISTTDIHRDQDRDIDQEIDDLSAAISALAVDEPNPEPITDLSISVESTVSVTSTTAAPSAFLRDTNAALIADIRAGNTTAIEAFCEMFRPYIRRYAASMSRKLNQQDIEDLTQEVLAVAMAKLGNFRGESQLRTWVIGITRNILLDRLRKMRRQDMHEVSLADLAVVVETEDMTQEGDPERTALERADAEQLHRALKIVSPPLREILILRYVRELSLREIAETTGESRSKVERKLAKAKRQIVAALDT